MIDLIQNKEQWSSTRDKLNEVITIVNSLNGEYIAKPEIKSISAVIKEKNIVLFVTFSNPGDWPLEQLVAQASTDKTFSTIAASCIGYDEAISEGGKLSGTIVLEIVLSKEGIEQSGEREEENEKVGEATYYCRVVWAGMVISDTVVAS